MNTISSLETLASVPFACRTPHSFLVKSCSSLPPPSLGNGATITPEMEASGVNSITTNALQVCLEMNVSVRLFTWSPDGKYLAIVLSSGLVVYAADSWSIVCQIDAAHIHDVTFSPLSNYISIFTRITNPLSSLSSGGSTPGFIASGSSPSPSPGPSQSHSGVSVGMEGESPLLSSPLLTSANAANVKNCSVWCLFHKTMSADGASGRKVDGGLQSQPIEIYSYYHRHQESWHIQWSADETYFARLSLSASELQFYRVEQAGKVSLLTQPTHRLQIEGLAAFAISRSVDPIRLAVFIGEKKGNPASVRIYQLPNLVTPVVMKSFFKADRVNLSWSGNGQHLLALAHTDVDGSGKSYYGETNLVFLSPVAGFDCHVRLDKEGPIHDFTWSTTRSEFIVVYGFMPAKAMLFDAKCTPIYDFGSSAKNFVRYNPQGNLICIAGFGNLAGNIELWNREKLTKFSQFQASGATVCEWCPNGRHLLLATLSPRLRVDNGYKIIDYCGQLTLKESFKELYQIDWCPASSQKFGSFALHPSAVSKSTVSNKPSAYVPPSLRGRPAGGSSILPVGLDPALATKMASGGSGKSKSKSKSNHSTMINKPPAATTGQITNSLGDIIDQPQLTEAGKKLTQKEKLVKNITKKLEQIRSLKEKQVNGVSLEDNQIDKISKEVDLLKELNSLNMDE